MDRAHAPSAPSLSHAFTAAPAVPLAAALLLGTALGREAVAAPPGPLVALALLGLALGGAGRSPARAGSRLVGAAGLAGVATAALACGFLNGHLRGGGPAFVPDPARPVTAVVETTGHWRRLDETWSAPARVESLRQGDRVIGGGAGLDPLYLHVSAEAAPGPFGARLRVKGYLDRPVRLGNPTPRAEAAPGPWRLRAKSGRLVSVETGPGRIDRLAGALRARVEEGLAAAAARTAGGVGLGLPFVRALLLGDAGDVPPAVKRSLRRLGLGHLLAVSGLHVGMVAGVVLLLATPLPRSVRWLAGLAAVGLYLLLVGPRPSLLRASAMACLAVVALLAERPPSARNALAVAAAVLVLARPAALGEPGFQLSVGATAGLLWLSPRLAERWARTPLLEGLPGPVREGLAVSAGAQLGTLPWALPLFCLLVPAAPLVNLVAVPWAAVLLVGCGLWTGLAALAAGSEAAAALAGPLLPALDLLAAPAGLLTALRPSPWTSLPLALGAAPAALFALALFACLARPRLGLPVLAAGLAWTATGAGDLVDRTGLAGPRAVPELVMIDVGQGDAILLRDGGETLLVDGGGWPAGDLGGRVLLPTLATLGVRRLDGVLLTHPDRDHCGGLVQIAGYLAVAEVWTGPAVTRAGATGCAAELLALPGVRRRTAAAGERLRVGRFRLEVLHPEEGEEGRPGSGDNDASVVLAAEVFGRRTLLTGDVEAAGERALVGRRRGLDCDVLKVAHHGSRSSTTPALLAAASPELALVSAGARNPYGHPAPEVLERLRRAGVRVLRTDRHGMVVLRFHPGGHRQIELPGPF